MRDIMELADSVCFITEEMHYNIRNDFFAPNVWRYRPWMKK